MKYEKLSPELLGIERGGRKPETEMAHLVARWNGGEARDVVSSYGGEMGRDNGVTRTFRLPWERLRKFSYENQVVSLRLTTPMAPLIDEAHLASLTERIQSQGCNPT